MKKLPNCLLMVLLAGVVALAGCGKSDKTPAQTAPGMMDLPKFQEAFVSATPDQRTSVAAAANGIRYGRYPEALTALANLDSDPALTPPQKQAISNLLEGIKQASAKAPAAPPQ
jgi:hypothetical protein